MDDHEWFDFMPSAGQRHIRDLEQRIADLERERDDARRWAVRLEQRLAGCSARVAGLTEALTNLLSANDELSDLVTTDAAALARPGQPGLGVVSRVCLAMLDAREALADAAPTQGGGE